MDDDDDDGVGSTTEPLDLLLRGTRSTALFLFFDLTIVATIVDDGDDNDGGSDDDRLDCFREVVVVCSLSIRRLSLRPFIVVFVSTISLGPTIRT